MGFLVMDEAFDCWASQKTQLDYHLLYTEWHEPDLRAMLHRDRNHPSIIMWSIGNEVGEQGGGRGAAAIAKGTHGYLPYEEDPTRPTDQSRDEQQRRRRSPFTGPIDLVGLTFQGAGLRSSNPQYPVFQRHFPEKVVLGSETVDAYSSRGYYPHVSRAQCSCDVRQWRGPTPGRRTTRIRSVRMIFSTPIGRMVPDYGVWGPQDYFPFVGGEFVWTGFDSYIGEPDPVQFHVAFFLQRHSRPCRLQEGSLLSVSGLLAAGVADGSHPAALELAGSARGRQVTPVHVYTSGDEAELFLNGKSLGRKKKGELEYRLRWDDVVYEPGELRVVAYKDGKQWATDTVKTTGDAAELLLTPDHAAIAGDGKDLSYVTLTVADKDGQMAPLVDEFDSFRD